MLLIAEKQELDKMSADAGKKIFTKACAQCHTVEQGGKHKQGGFLIPFLRFF